MPRTVKETKYNAYHRQASNKYYHTPNGRITAKLYYLRKKHSDNTEMLNILNDTTLDKMERYEKVKHKELQLELNIE